MIGTIRKHQNWLWFIIIAAIIISFVYFFSPNAKMNYDQGPRIDLGSINGERITPRQFSEAQKEAMLGMFLRYGEWPKQDERLNQMLEESAYERLVIIAKLKQLNVEVTPEATARMVKQMFRLEPNQSLSAEDFNRFVVAQLLPNKITADDFERFVAHQVGLQHLISVFGMSGKLITPKEAESFYVRENAQIVSQAAIFNYSNYLSQVTASPAAVAEYYTNNQANYRLPKRVQVNYVKFDLAKFEPEVDKEMAADTNLSARISAIYAQQGPEAFKTGTNVMGTNEAFAQIKTRMREFTALSKAKQAAYTFLNDLDKAYSDTNPYKPEDFEKFAQSKGLSVKTTEPFNMQDGPKDIKSEEFVQRAFRLMIDPTEPSHKSLFSSSPIATEDGVYAISLKNEFPSAMQPLDAIRAQVTADYSRSRAMDLAMNAGVALANAATNGLAAGKSFASIAEAQKIKPKSLTPFSLMTRTIPEVNANDFERLQRVASTLPDGKSSQLIPGEYGGYVLYVEKRLPVDTAKMNAELPDYTARLREQRQNAAFGAWFQQAAKEMNLVMPTRSRM